MLTSSPSSRSNILHQKEMMNNNYKSDFPIFSNNPKLVYLDNAATTQKPKCVIDAVSEYLQQTNANIHRGIYDIAEKSENLYWESKTKYATLIGANSDEIIYTYNATYAMNLITTSLLHSEYLEPWDTILLGIRDHHANILPRQVLAEQVWCKILYLELTSEYLFNRDDFRKKYDKTVKVVSIWAISNVLGTLFPIEEISNALRKETLYVVDATQAVWKQDLNVWKIGCHMLVATAHKMMWLTGLWMLYMKAELIKSLKPGIVWWGTVEDVTTQWYTHTFGVEKRESWTPNIVGAIGLGEAINYLYKIGGVETIAAHDKMIWEYILKEFAKRNSEVSLFWPTNYEHRIGIFSFTLKKQANQIRIGEYMANNNIAIRCGWHCTYPLRHYLTQHGSCRISTYIYNTISDIDAFFYQLDCMV